MGEGLVRSVLRALFTVNDTAFVVVATLLFVFEIGVSYLLIQKVPCKLVWVGNVDWLKTRRLIGRHTCSKWSAWWGRTLGTIHSSKETRDLLCLLHSDVLMKRFSYPAGHIWAYSFLYSLTNSGKDIRAGQYIFALFYLVNLALVFKIYYKSKRVGTWLNKDVRSRFLRSFCHFSVAQRIAYIPSLCFAYSTIRCGCGKCGTFQIAVLLFHVALNFFVNQHWFYGCIFYRLAKTWTA